MKNKILILNGSHSEISLIREAKRLGLQVLTTGDNPNLIGHKESHFYFESDYSNPDAVLEICKSHQVDYICACANDAGILTASVVAEQLGLPGYDRPDICKKIHLKDQFKNWALNFGLPSPRRFEEQAIDTMDFPVIVKPIDMTGGKGIAIVQKKEDLDVALANAKIRSRQGKVIIEKFIDGPLQSFSTMIVKERVVACYNDIELSTMNPYTVSASYSPAEHLDQVKEPLIEITESMASELGLVDGIVHYQYIWDGSKFYILEITRRTSGDLYPRPVSLALNVCWEQATLLTSMGRRSENVVGAKQKGHYGRVCFMAKKNGILDGYTIHENLKKNVVESYYGFEKGFKITQHTTQKLGVVILKFDSFDEASEKAKYVNEWTSVHLK